MGINSVCLCIVCVCVCVCMLWTKLCPLKIRMLKSLPPVPQNVTVFGAWTFKEVIKLI